MWICSICGTEHFEEKTWGKVVTCPQCGASRDLGHVLLGAIGDEPVFSTEAPEDIDAALCNPSFRLTEDMDQDGLRKWWRRINDLAMKAKRAEKGGAE